MTDEQIAAIAARAAAATPGPWGIDRDGEIFPLKAGGSYDIQGEIAAMVSDNPNDGVFVCAARQDIPALLAALAASQAREARLRGALEVIANIEAGTMTHTRTAGEVARAALEGAAPRAEDGVASAARALAKAWGESPAHGPLLSEVYDRMDDLIAALEAES